MSDTLKSPVRNESRAALRRVIESAAQFTPVTAFFAHLYGYTYPTQFEQDVERFWQQVAATVNDHEARLDQLEAFLSPRMVVSPFAVELVLWLLRQNKRGRPELVEFDHLVSAFPDVGKDQLEEACAELAHYGYAVTQAMAGKAIHHMRLTPEAFLAFDRAATGLDTRADALTIAALWLDRKELHSVQKLREHLNWEVRRLNPALNVLLSIFPDGRRSGQLHPEFAVVFVLVTPDERFKLRQLVQSGRVD